MRLPTRRAERLKHTQDEGVFYISASGLQKLQAELERLEKKELPEALEDVRRTGEFGDFSENAEYQEAKGRMRRIHTRIFSMKEKIKRAVVIQKNAQDMDRVQLGSVVVLEQDGKQSTFEIVGAFEADPTHQRISYLSPLGAALLHRTVDETVVLSREKGEKKYRIISIE